MAYDPVRAHEYYERTKRLKGRKKGTRADAPSQSRDSKPGKPSASRSPGSDIAGAKARVGRLKSKVSTLQGALSEALAALSEKRQESAKTEKKNSDGKSTAEEKLASKKYREKHQQEIASKRKSDGSSGGGASKSSSNSVSSMSVEDLESRVIRIRGLLKEAQRQLSNASQQLGQLAHSAITSEPGINEHFARFRSEERIPSHDSNSRGSGLQWLRHAE